MARRMRPGSMMSPPTSSKAASSARCRIHSTVTDGLHLLCASKMLIEARTAS